MSEEAAVKEVLSGYYAVFSSLDMSVIAPFFHEPSVFIGKLGVFPAADRTALGQMLGPAMQKMRDEGYGRSELELRRVKMLSATEALAEGVAHRFRTSGEALTDVGVTYVLHKGAEGWKLAVVVLHDPD